jgi:hypothetical protein
MRKALGSIAAAALAAMGASPGLAAEQEILGRRLLVRDPHGDETHRSVAIVGRETATDIAALAGDPTTGGATLMLGVNSGSSGQLFVLDASGWSPTASGFRYDGPTASGDPVKRVVLRRTNAGTASLEIVLKGNVGGDPLDVVPPDPGSDAIAMLRLADGDTYCVSFGGAAGGRVITNTAATWRVMNATAQPGCPAGCCSFGASCIAVHEGDPSVCTDTGGTSGFPGSVCDGATGGCSPPPAGAGNCCEFAGGALCFGGPGVQQPPCDEIGGAFVSAAVCDPDLGCVVP